MDLLQIYNEFSRKQKIILFTGLFFIFYTIFGFFILPKIIQTVSVDKLTQFFGRKVTIQKVKFNPYSLFLTVEGMNIKQKKSEQHFVSFNNLFVNIQSSSLFKHSLVIRNITIDGLSVNAIRNKDLTYNFIDLIPSKTKDKALAEKSINKAEKKSPKKFRFLVSNIVLNNGKIIIEFLDPIYLTQENRDNLRSAVNDIHQIMSDKIKHLSDEAATFEHQSTIN